jgi:hypothetical protein
MTILKIKVDKIKQDKKAKILGLAEEDQQQIAEIDNIRLSALNSINFVLDM